MKTLIIANWKMNPKSLKEAQELFEAVKAGVKKNKNVEVVICPPFMYLPALINKGLAIGAQNCHWEAQGAYTGEVSPAMLADAGAEYIILGHSERRRYLGETDEIINLKLKAALKARLKPIICIGEKEGEGIESVVENQLTKILVNIPGGQLKNIIIMYEPVWAISTTAGCKKCSPDEALSASLFIRRVIAKLYSRFFSDQITIVYGGSVDSKNIADYVVKAGLAGALVGAASLKAEEFIKIVKTL